MKSDAGVLIASLLADRGWTQQVLAQILGRPSRFVSQVISGKTQITVETAMQLAAVFGNTAEEWMQLDSAFRLRVAENLDVSDIKDRAALFSKAPIRELEKRQWIASGGTINELSKNLDDFFNDELSIFTRRSSQDGLSRHQRAWCYRAAQIAKDIPVKKFSKNRFESGIEELQKLTVWPEEARKVPSVLSDMGIKFVVVEPLPKTRIDGAAFWIGESPVICLSLRFDRIDSFWHTLGHELSHVRHGDPISVDTNIVGQEKDALINDIEKRADREAAEMWISKKELDKFVQRVSPFFEMKKVNRFASRLKVHPGIIVGQLQHRKEISYATFRPALCKIREQVLSAAIVDGWGRVISM